MPSTTLVCPHCEKTVEIQVSSVTRSRPCPACGQIVMLQMAEKSTRQKRRALLMGQAGEQPAEPQEEKEETPTTSSMRRMEPAHEPQPLQGDAFERMRMDPEVKEFRRRLIIGASVVGAVVVLLIIFNLIQSSKESDAREKLLVPGGREPGAPATTASTPMITPEESQLPVAPGSLVFRPQGKSDLKTASSASKKPEDINLARLAAGEDMLRKFLQAIDWKQRLPLVRNPSRAEPLMHVYYQKNGDGPVPFDSLVEAAEGAPGFTEHVVVLEGGGRRIATVEHTPQGPRVDWESFVGAGETSWSDFLDSKSVTPTLFRVLVSPAGHFEHQFGDPQMLKCYSLRNVSEPGAKVVYGYLDRKGELAKELDYWLDKSVDETAPMMLRLKFPPDAVADFQVWIHQFVQAGWVRR